MVPALQDSIRLVRETGAMIYPNLLNRMQNDEGWLTHLSTGVGAQLEIPSANHLHHKGKSEGCNTLAYILLIGIWRESRYMNVLLYLGIFWTLYGLAGLLGWQRINNKYKGYDWTKKYIRCLGISWLMLGIPCLIFSRLYEAGYNTRSMFVLMCFCMLPSLIFTIVVEKKFNAKIKDTQR